MSVRFVYPCPECKASIELLPKQAGQNIACPQCQQSVGAPKLGDLKRLPTIGDESETTRKSSSAQRALFTIGFALLVLCGLGGLLLRNYAGNLILELDWEFAEKAIEAEVNKLSPNEMLSLWEKVDFGEGLGNWVELDIARYRTQGKILLNVAYGLLVCAGVGLIMMICSMFPSKRLG